MINGLENWRRETPTAFSWSDEGRWMQAEMKVLVSGVRWSLSGEAGLVTRGFVPWQRSVLWYSTGRRGEGESDFEVTIRKAAAYVEALAGEQSSSGRQAQAA